jgi:hypothetical protein
MNPDPNDEHQARLVQSMQPAARGKSAWFKQQLVAVGAIIAFVLAFGAARWLSYEGTSKVLDTYNEKRTEQRVGDYFAETSSWKEFSSPVGQFRATFPAYPAHDANTANVPGTDLAVTLDTYSSATSDGTTFVVTTGVFPPEVDTSNPNANLEGSLNGMIASTEGNRLLSSSPTNFNGHPAMDFVISNDTFNLKGTIMLADHRFYQVMVLYELKNRIALDANYNNFLNSFATY